MNGRDPDLDLDLKEMTAKTIHYINKKMREEEIEEFINKPENELMKWLYEAGESGKTFKSPTHILMALPPHLQEEFLKMRNVWLLIEKSPEELFNELESDLSAIK